MRMYLDLNEIDDDLYEALQAAFDKEAKKRGLYHELGNGWISRRLTFEDWKVSCVVCEPYDGEDES